MSDEEEFYSEESYEFEFEEDDEDGEKSVQHEDDAETEPMDDFDIESKYYTAKGFKDDEPETALKELRKIAVDSDSSVGDNIEWIFKSYKQLIKLNFKNQNLDQALEYLQEMFILVPQLSKSYVEESISKMITRYSTVDNKTFMHTFYDLVLNHIGQSNDRIWLKVNTNLLNIYLENQEYDKCPELIQKIHTKLEDVSESTRKSFTLETIAAEIDYMSRTKNLKLSRMIQLYRKSLDITTAVTHPKILGTIRECGGKVQFYRCNYEKARLEFYESFKSYDEAGSPLKNKILKYLALCSLLTENEFNPFDTRETRTYTQMPEFSNLLLLVQEYHKSDLTKFGQVLDKMQQEKDELYLDDIFTHASKQILSNLRSNALMNYLRAYKSISSEVICNKLQLDQSQLELLVLKLVNEGRLADIKIDFLNKIIYSEGETEHLIPPVLSPKDIYCNIKALDLINLDSGHSTTSYDHMEIDNPKAPVYFTDPPGTELEEKPISLLNKLFLLIDKPLKSNDWFKAIEDWNSFMVSSVPPSVKTELSQKDQIHSEQRAENAMNVSTSVNIAATAKGGLLADDSLDQDESFSVEQIHKIDLLRATYRNVQSYYDTLNSK
ncbi:COP9 signalosome complex subunit 2 [Spathaspora sp. JA1]|nr:COP9 signalosome complex subunit 2 [Spathaspora sp. JA1]